jgi:DNA-binding NarL/FixJ family response regulator
MPSIKLLIADDHPVVLSGLRAMLSSQPDFDVIGEAEDGAGILALLGGGARPDVVLTDLRMPNMDGVATTTAIRRAYPHIRVIILTTYDADRDILPAIQAGATGYLLKDAPREEVFRSIRAAARGESVLDPSVAARLMTQIRLPQEALSARETEVLRMVARGATNRAIGEALHISEATVKTHLIHIFGKLNVSDRTAAVTAAQERGML